MSWPTSQDYNEAVQSPGTSFGDAELRAGEAATNALGLPIPRSGAFADVYEFNCQSGNRWAVKCFTRAVEGQKDRYQAISEHLARAALPFMVDFQYLPQGVRVRGAWFPILKMRWVQGLTLNEFVRENVEKRPLLEGLIQIWLRMAKRLRDAKLAHADLQHGNVLLIPGASAGAVAVRLIDYDGMFVPALEAKPSGEVGHPAYQHAQRLREGTYTTEVDRFPLLAITTALRCLMSGGRALWDRYDNGDNLLFCETDLRDPAASPLFRDLKYVDDPVARALVGELERAATLDIRETPHADELYESLTTAKKSAMPKQAAPAAPSAPVATVFTGHAMYEDEHPSDDSFGAASRPVRKPAGGIAWGVIGASVVAGLACVVALMLVIGGKKPPTESEPEFVENKEPPKVAVAPTKTEPRIEPKVAEPKVAPMPPDEMPVANAGGRDAWEVDGKWALLPDGTARHEGTASHAKLTFGDPSWGDYVLRVRVRTSDGSGAVSLHFRRPSAGKCVSFAVNVGDDKKEILDLVDNGKTAKVIRSGTGQSLVADQFAELRAEARGRKVRCFKNDQLVGEYEGDDVPERGGVSIAAFVNPGVRAEFTDITATDPAGKVLWRGLPDVKPQPGEAPAGRRSVWFPPEGKWESFPDGRLRHEGLDFFAGVSFGEPTWRDYDFRADVTESDVGDDYVGMAFRVMNTRRCGTFQVSASRPAVIDQLVHDLPGRPSMPLLGPIPSRRFTPGKAEELLVKVRGPKVECFRDNKQVFDYEGAALSAEGGVGFRSWTLKGRWVEFANIKVTDPAGLVLWEGPPDLRAAGPGQTVAAAPPVPRLAGTRAQSANGRVVSAGFAGPKRLILGGSGTDSFVETRDIPGLTPAGKLDVGDQNVQFVAHVSFAPDGKYAAVIQSLKGERLVLRLWNLATRKMVKELPPNVGVDNRLVASAFSSDGKLLATVSAGGHAAVWDLTRSAKLKDISYDASSFTGAEFTADRKSLMTIGHLGSPPAQGVVRLWGLESSEVFDPFPEGLPPVTGLSLSPDGRLAAFACEDKTIRVYDLKQRKVMRQLEGHTQEYVRVAFSPDSQRLVSVAAMKPIDGPGNRGGEAKLWDAETGKELARFRGQTEGLMSVRYAPDGGGAAAVGYRGEVVYWDFSRLPRQVASGNPVTPTTPTTPAERVPLPTKDDIDAADKLLRESFRKELAAADKPDELKALAAEVMKVMREAKYDAPGRFASLLLARDLAVAAKDADLAFAAAGQIESDFVVPPPSQVVAAIQALSRSATPTTTAMNKAIIEHAFEASERCIIDCNFDVASGVISTALIVAGKAQSTAASQSRLQGRMALIGEARKAAEVAKAAEEKLLADPANAVAAFEHGKYLCEWRSMWKEGLPLLAKGSDADWKAAANLDLAAPTGAAEEFAAGEAWSARADAVKGNPFIERNLRARAARWFEGGLGRFDDADQATALRGLEKLSELRKTAGVKDPSLVALFNGRDATGWTAPNGGELKNWAGSPAGMKGGGPRNNGTIAKSSRADFGDFYLKAVLDIDGDSLGNALLVRYASRDGNRSEGYKLSLSAASPGELTLYQGNQESVLAAAKPIRLAALKNVTVEVFAVGSKFKVKVNGEQALDADAPNQYPDGGFGLIAGANGGITVKKLEVRPLPKPAE